MELKARPDLLVHADALPPGVEEVPLRGAVQVLPPQTTIVGVQIQGRDPVAADTVAGESRSGSHPACGTRRLARRLIWGTRGLRTPSIHDQGIVPQIDCGRVWIAGTG